MSVTIRDVAQEAGVSVATVSRVFNGSGPVKEATRQRVASVARALRYTPNSAARSLSTRRTHAVGALLPKLYGEFFSEVIRGIDKTAQQHEYHLLVSSSHNNTAEIEAALQALRGRVEGLIVMSPDVDAETLSANLPENLPVVLLNCHVSGGLYNTVNIDNYGGAYDMVCHLLDRGHRDIAFITGPGKNYDARERLQGYRAALRERGIEELTQLEITGDFTVSAGYEAVAQILALTPRATALFAANDSMAIGALSALAEAGVRVPQEMAVAGFDDIPIARYFNPRLTSVQVSIHELGARAMQRLLEAVEHPMGERYQETLPVRVVGRESTGGE